MTIAKLELRRFRNFAEASLEPSPGFNIVVGPNAQGKTNLLESIHLVSTGRLLRGSRDVQAILDGESEGRVEAEVGGTATRLAVELKQGARKRALLNGLALPRAADLLGRLPTVCFTASDLAIVRGEPADRRLFLDGELAQIFPAYLRHLTVYKRALEQRNAALRASQERPQPEGVFLAYEEPLAAHGAALRRIRRDWVEELARYAADWHARLGEGEPLALRYQPKDDAAEPEELQQKLEAWRFDDIRRGATSVGPHRDDLLVEVGGRDARFFGSQGQQRTAVIALKMATLETAKLAFGFAPVLLLDDVFSDLDCGRRASLVETAVHEGGQVFLTCTEVEQAGVELVGRSKVFRVRSGQVSMA